MGGVSSTIGVVTSISMKSSIIDAPRESGHARRNVWMIHM